MVYHSVLFKFKQDTSRQTTDAFIEALTQLNDKIKAILYLHAGYNFASRGKGFEVMLASAFASKAKLEEYQKHPAHIAFVENYVKPYVEDIIAGDIEV
ncbi:MAG: Dabb family protein [Cytophagales bacterium]|nr:Dabb family protein [Cytophagales bacterium]MDW8385005.1 Dabb family protein [Flammeovirgaceae bacterium]